MLLTRYSADMEKQMREFYDSLDERSRRRYAALEAGRLGHGGVAYISEILGCDPKTIRQADFFAFLCGSCWVDGIVGLLFLPLPELCEGAEVVAKDRQAQLRACSR